MTRRREGVKRRDHTDLADHNDLADHTDLASIQSPKCVLHSPEHPKRFTDLGREEKGEGGGRGDLGEKRESQKGERVIKPVITLLSKNGYWRLDS